MITGKYMQKMTSQSSKVFGRQSKEFRKIGGQAFWPRLYILNKHESHNVFLAILSYWSRDLSYRIPVLLTNHQVILYSRPYAIGQSWFAQCYVTLSYAFLPQPPKRCQSPLYNNFVSIILLKLESFGKYNKTRRINTAFLLYFITKTDA